MTGFRLTTAAAAVALLALLQACSPPKGAGQATQILAGAEEEDADFAAVAITRDSVATIARWPGRGGGSPVVGWIERSRGPASNAIAAGDKVDVTIWETGEGTLLTAPGQKLVSLQGLTVSPDGSIFLPYADKVYVANMTPDEARVAIQGQLERIIPSAQVLLGHVPGRRSTVDLVSGVAAPGSFPLPDRDFTVLALIAVGGGISPSLENPQVRLQRGGKLYGISAERLLATPSLDTTLRGGDKVYVEDDSRYFLALGAAGNEAQVPFSQERITALDALSLIGGLNEARADAKSILILRDYASEQVRSDGSGPPKDRVVFTIDLTTADGLFSAGEFHIQNRDVVVIAESPVPAARSILGLFGAVFGVANAADNVAN
jgi:polysaccharide biosynthesis/export protein